MTSSHNKNSEVAGIKRGTSFSKAKVLTTKSPSRLFNYKYKEGKLQLVAVLVDSYVGVYQTQPQKNEY